MSPAALATRGEQRIRADEEALLAAALDGVQELNERCLELLRRLASGPGYLPRSLAPLARDFALLDPATMASAAKQPFLLIDFSFGNPTRFRAMLAKASPTLRHPPSSAALPAPDAAGLARGALILAQAICRHHPAHAGLLLGLHPTLISPIATLRLPHLEQVAESFPEDVKLRWNRRTDVWRYLMEASASPDPVGREQFRMYGIQLMAAVTVPRAR